MFLVRNNDCITVLCTGSWDVCIPGLCFVILDYSYIQDSGNMKWRLMILDYDRSTGLCLYYRILGTRNGGFNTPWKLDIAFVLSIVKLLRCWSYISETYLLMLISWIFLKDNFPSCVSQVSRAQGIVPV